MIRRMVDKLARDIDKRFFLSIALFILIANGICAQSLDERVNSITRQMERYRMRMRPAGLFVHFDKNIYTPSEYIWLTGYLLDAGDAAGSHSVLCIALIRHSDSAVITTEKFVMQRGLSFGQFLLPDTIRAGSYSLLAYTNLMTNGRHETRFIQPITIKAPFPPEFSTSLKLASAVMPGADSAQIVFKAFSKDIHTLISFADLEYNIGSGKSRTSGRLKTDATGERYFKVPLQKTDARGNRLEVKVNYKGQQKQLQLYLPVASKKNSIRFFPEGGNLVAGVSQLIGWEARNESGQPMAATAVLYKNDKPADTIHTDVFGIGRFQLQAESVSAYRVKLLSASQPAEWFDLPKSQAEGVAIHLPNGLVKDTLDIRVTDTSARRLFFLLHDYTDAFYNFHLMMPLVSGKTLRVPLDEVPRGLCSITVLDEQNRPLAERLFFAHYDRKPALVVSTDRELYSTLQKVQLRISLPGTSTEGLVSVACVQDNRIDPWKWRDIETYTYLSAELADLPFKRDPLGADHENRHYLEDILLVKGWRRYTWQDMQAVQASDPKGIHGSPVQYGSVKPEGKLKLKGIHLNMITSGLPKQVITDSAGRFILNDTDLIMLPDKKALLVITEKNQSDYRIQYTDIYKQAASSMARNLDYDALEILPSEVNNEEQALKKGETPFTLAGVTVKSGENDYITAGTGRNNCGDWVCFFNVLNCPNHPTGTLPIKGRRYKSVKGIGGSRSLHEIVYEGCVENDGGYLMFLKGIYTAKEFYNADYTTEADQGPFYKSTIFWDYATPVSSAKPSDISFYTSDIPGKFRVIVQGITNAGVVHAEWVFEVKSNAR